eukprot:TRINITY_DN12834_c0_g1_i1.p1 TRINITY_DN12834_c0_g1~~TRINITY_DN12834_c0_g1_i1.p1  ORF type:complete len:602 (+),score=193.38 TRINITY_DN12834_c0_g1_i1:39-1844(+)
MADLGQWLPRTETAGQLSADLPLIIKDDKINIGVWWEKQSWSNSTLAVHAIPLKQSGDSAASAASSLSVNSVAALAAAAASAEAEAKKKPAVAADAAEDGSAEGGDGEDGDEAAPPADPPAEAAADEEAEEEDPDAPKPVPPPEIEMVQITFSGLPADYQSVAIVVTAEPNFDEFMTVSYRLINAASPDVEFGRVSVPAKGANKALVLGVLVRDSLTKAFSWVVANGRGEDATSTAQAVVKENGLNIVRQHDPLYTWEVYDKESQLAATKLQKFTKAEAQAAADQQAENASDRIGELTEDIADRIDLLPELKEKLNAEAEAKRADGDDTAADEIVAKMEAEEAGIEKAKAELEEVKKVFETQSQLARQLQEEVEELERQYEAQLQDTVAAKAANTQSQPPVQSKLERTYAMIKPDAVAAGSVDGILTMIAAAGFTVCARKRVQLTRAEAAEFYKEHYGKSFYDGLCKFMSSGPIEALVLGKVDAIKAWRALMGPTNTQTAQRDAPNSIRARFGTDGTRNATHGSDSVASARREIAFFFPNSFGPTPSADQVREYTQQHLQPVLVKALTELCKSKPTDPVIWLGDWLVEHNPARPQVSAPAL